MQSTIYTTVSCQRVFFGIILLGIMPIRLLSGITAGKQCVLDGSWLGTTSLSRLSFFVCGYAKGFDQNALSVEIDANEKL